VRVGPSGGIDFGALESVTESGEASARRVLSFSGELASGNLDSSPCEAEDRSMTPRWIKREGRTLSVNTGTWDVSGMGNGGGDADPKRITTAWMRNRAFLKQYIAGLSMSHPIQRNMRCETYIVLPPSTCPGKQG